MAELNDRGGAGRQGRLPLVVVAATLAVTALAFAVAGLSGARSQPAPHALLLQAHLAAGLKCASCHVEKPPATPVQTVTCLGCHNSYAELAAKTQAVYPNPHASHQGDLPCESCHHMHKPSQDFCASCHSWGFTVP